MSGMRAAVLRLGSQLLRSQMGASSQPGSAGALSSLFLTTSTLGSATTTPAASFRQIFASTRMFAAAAAEQPAPKKSQMTMFTKIMIAGCTVGGLFAYTLVNGHPQQQGALHTGKSPAPDVSVKIGDYGAVRQAIADVLDVDGYDDGSYGPILVRLAWHASGSYDKATNTGGSNGATMRFPPEANYGANNGLLVARNVLEPIKAKFPWITYADLWTLAGVVAIEEMGGPSIPWRPGRSDAADGGTCGPDGRLPDASQGAAHLRSIFNRMGFNDQEIVALSGAHALGRCHTDRSGYTDPWTNAPTTFSNLYFKELKERKWVKKKWNGPLQYADKESGQLMMLPTDMALLSDRTFRKWVDKYAADEELFFKDFSAAFSKLLELGVPFPSAQTAAA